MPWYRKGYIEPRHIERQPRVRALEEDVALLKLEIRYLREVFSIKENPEDSTNVQYKTCDKCVTSSQDTQWLYSLKLGDSFNKYNCLCYKCFKEVSSRTK